MINHLWSLSNQLKSISYFSDETIQTWYPHLEVPNRALTFCIWSHNRSCARLRRRGGAHCTHLRRFHAPARYPPTRSRWTRFGAGITNYNAIACVGEELRVAWWPGHHYRQQAYPCPWSSLPTRFPWTWSHRYLVATDPMPSDSRLWQTLLTLMHGFRATFAKSSQNMTACIWFYTLWRWLQLITRNIWQTHFSDVICNILIMIPIVSVDLYQLSCLQVRYIRTVIAVPVA